MKPQPTTHTLDFQGLALAYTRWSGTDASLTPVLFVHGGSANQFWWHPTIEPLQTERECVAMDLSGHGLSGWLDSYTFTQWADEVRHLATTLFPDGCYLVGHSLGGALSFTATANGYPARALALIDIDPASFTRKDTPELSTIPPPRMFATEDEAIAAVIKYKLTWPADIARFIGERSVHQVGDSWQMWRDPRVASSHLVARPLEDVTNIPVDIVLAANSQYNISTRAHLQPENLLPNFSVEVLPGLGHDILVESPERMADVLRAFFARHDSTSSV